MGIKKFKTTIIIGLSLLCCILNAQKKDSVTILNIEHAKFHSDSRLLYLEECELQQLKKAGIDIEQVATYQYKWKDSASEVVTCKGKPTIYKYVKHDKRTSICIACIIDNKVESSGAFRAYASQ